jgi:hypothetical protein
MADDLNALAPKPVDKPAERLPTEADYEAIVATMTQSARGRWFLAEYARRNRNADTRMVLDAVARIEASMAKTPPVPQVQSPQVQVPQVQIVDHAPAIAAALAEVRRRAMDILGAGAASREIVQQHVKALRELTWTLREWGTDNALCDRLDAHASAIAETPLPDANALLAVFGDAPRGNPAPVASMPPADAITPVADAPPIPANVDAAVAVLKPETLGAALLTQGLVATPRNADALSALRRMTQAEKVALFT